MLVEITSGPLRPQFSETHYNGLIFFTLMAWDSKERGCLLVGFLKNVQLNIRHAEKQRNGLEI